MQKQSAVNSVAEEADTKRTHRRGEWTISYRFAVQRSLPVVQYSGPAGDPREVLAGSAATRPAWFSRFFARMAEQLINDFASAAAAIHPEALLLMGGEAGYDEVARNRRDESRSQYWRNEPPVEFGSRYPQAMRARPKSLATPLPGRQHPSRNPVPVDAPMLGWGGWIMSRALTLQAKIRNARETRRGLAALRSMDDRMLRDIGVRRHEIERLARYGR